MIGKEWRQEDLSDEECRRRRRILRTFIPAIIPAGWRLEVSFTPTQMRAAKGGLIGAPPILIAIAGIEVHDGHDWVHLSVSRPGSEPTWKDLVDARDIFLGPETQAFQALPPRSEYYEGPPGLPVVVHHVWAFADRGRVSLTFVSRGGCEQ